MLEEKKNREQKVIKIFKSVAIILSLYLFYRLDIFFMYAIHFQEEYLFTSNGARILASMFAPMAAIMFAVIMTISPMLIVEILKRSLKKRK